MGITTRLSVSAAIVLSLAARGESQDATTGLWNQVRICEELNLLGKMPEVIRSLERVRTLDAADRTRRTQAIARLSERLGDLSRAVTCLRAVMNDRDPSAARQAAIDFARLAPRTGRCVEARRVLRHWTRRDRRSAAHAHLGLARLELDLGNARCALEHIERARQHVEIAAVPAEALRYEATWLEGCALERAGLRAAALDRYWRHLVRASDACLRDPRIPRAIERLHRARGDLPALRETLTAHARRAGTFSAYGTLLEYVDMMDMVSRGNALGLMADLEGIDPPLWTDLDGSDWHYFAAARALVARNPRLARDAVLSHAERNGDFTFGVYILGLVGDDASLDRLYRLAVSATNARELKNITTAIARNRRAPTAERLLRRLLRASGAAEPRHLRDAASFALACLPRGTS